MLPCKNLLNPHFLSTCTHESLPNLSGVPLRHFTLFSHLEEHSVAKLDLIPEATGGGAGVEELVAVVLLGHVGEVEVALGVHSHPGGVGRFQGAVSSLEQGNKMNSDIKFCNEENKED